MSNFAQKLISTGEISLPQMKQALIEVRKTGRSLAVVLEEMLGQSLLPQVLHKQQKVSLSDSVAAKEASQKFKEDSMNHSDSDVQAQLDATIVSVTEVFEEEPPNFNTNQGHAADDLNHSPEQNEAPIITLVNKILIMGMRDKASEIHLEPEENKLLVRIRQGGNLRNLFDPLPKKLITPIINRLKTMVGLDLTQTKIPQKGRLRKSYNGCPVYFFVHTLPSFYGEKIVVRIVESLTEFPDLATLIPDQITQTAIKTLNQRKSGLILVTGPAYSGISTTLELFLAQQQKQELSIATIEDPIRRTFHGITQVEVNLAKDFTYVKALQSVTQQAADVIMVDQIEDSDIFKEILSAVNQGHLVFTSLCAKDFVSAIAQLNEWVKPTDLAENLSGIINQRLLRRVCPTCRLVHQPEKEELQKLQLSPRQHQSSSFYRANTLNQELIKQFRLKGRLCRQCNGAGYHGQVGVYEILTLTTVLRSLICKGVDAETLKKVASEEGMKPLIKNALDRVLQGDTTLEEFFRVFPDALTTLTQVHTSAILPQGFQERLADLEQSLANVTNAFIKLKQSLNLTSSSLQEDFAPATQKEIDLSDVTLVGDTELYEEFGNPEKWAGFKKEVALPQSHPSAIAPEPTQENNQDLDKTVINPFKSVLDPW